MKSKILFGFIGCILVCATIARADVSFSVNPGADWIGYINWYQIPSNGGGYVSGSTWGWPDLTSVFSGGSQLTLGPNSVADNTSYWYTPMGEPGATGNKTMDANLYVQRSDLATGQNVTFSGNVVSNTFSGGYTETAFVKEFDPSYNLLLASTMNLTPGPFSVSLSTIPAAPMQASPNIIQYGFEMVGPDVWSFDSMGNFVYTSAARAAVGNAVVQVVPGDFNGDGHVDASDIALMEKALTEGSLAFATQQNYLVQPAGGPTAFEINAAIERVTSIGDINGDGVFNNADLQYLLNLLKSGGGSTSAVPEPASFVLLALGVLAFVGAKKRFSARI